MSVSGLRFFTRNSAWLFTVAILSASLGCGGGKKADSNRSTVSGAVTFDGQPLPAGTITFEAKTGYLATQVSIRNGRYSTDRAPIGENLVGVDTASIQYGNASAFVAIPEKYATPTTSGLTADIKPGENENVNFDLKK